MSKSFIGIDVSKNNLDVHILPEALSFSYRYETKAIKALIKKLKSYTPELVVLEATGGYEISIGIALSDANLNVAIVNPGVMAKNVCCFSFFQIKEPVKKCPAF